MGVQSRGGWVSLGEALRRRWAWVVVVVEGVVSVGVLVAWTDDSVDAGAAEVVVVVLEVLVGGAV